MKLNLFKTLSFLVVGAVLFGASATAFADEGKNHEAEKHEGGTTQVLVVNAKAGDVISAYQFAFSPDAAGDIHAGLHGPEGSLLESQTPVQFNGQAIFFVPTLMPSVIYTWNEAQGYRYLGQLAPSDSTAAPTLDAAGK
jgi:hypothetical protein